MPVWFTPFWLFPTVALLLRGSQTCKNCCTVAAAAVADVVGVVAVVDVVVVAVVVVAVAVAVVVVVGSSQNGSSLGSCRFFFGHFSTYMQIKGEPLRSN